MRSQFSRLTPDGGVLVADHITQTLYHYAPDGALRWRAGQRGEGPGEFRLLANFGADAGPARSPWIEGLPNHDPLAQEREAAYRHVPFPTPPPTLVAPVLWAETGACSAWLAKEPDTMFPPGWP